MSQTHASTQGSAYPAAATNNLGQLSKILPKFQAIPIKIEVTVSVMYLAVVRGIWHAVNG